MRRRPPKGLTSPRVTRVTGPMESNRPATEGEAHRRPRDEHGAINTEIRAVDPQAVDNAPLGSLHTLPGGFQTVVCGYVGILRGDRRANVQPWPKPF